MRILKYRIRNEWWKRWISNKNALIRKKVFTLAWGGFWLVRKRVNANNGRWKCILRINSSKRIKKVIWLCSMGQQNLTNQRTDLIPQHLKCCYGHSEMPEQSLSKYFYIIASQNCYTTAFTNSSIHLRKQRPHSLCFVCSLWGARNL